MDAKQYLKRAKGLQKRIDCKKRQLKKVEDDVIHITPILKTDVIDINIDISRKSEDYIITKERIQNEIARLEKLQDDISQTIDLLEINCYTTILTEYYINGMTWEEVAAKEGYTWRWTMELRKRAIKEIQCILDSKC